MARSPNGSTRAALHAHVSVTDEADYAASFVVVEQESCTMTTTHAPAVIDSPASRSTTATGAASRIR